MTSIVIPASGGRELTAACIESVARWSDLPHEVVLVDNGSPDDTAQWFADRGEGTLVRAREPLGFAAAVNMGIAASDGDVVVLLNNDTVVCEGWLRALRAPLDADSPVGLSGALSNYVIAEQRIDGMPYPGDELDRFARQWRASHDGSIRPVARLSGLCLAISRGVIDRIGGFDPRFYPGYFEDDDYALRARRAGFALVVCEDALVWHKGSQTIHDDVEGARRGQRLMVANLARFMGKWELARYEDPVSDLAHLLAPDGRDDFIALPALGG